LVGLWVFAYGFPHGKLIDEESESMRAVAFNVCDFAVWRGNSVFARLAEKSSTSILADTSRHGAT
jgi:hypothetical protein